MNEVLWHECFKKYISCYDVIGKLQENGIADSEIADHLYFNLLDDIITTFKSEVED